MIKSFRTWLSENFSTIGVAPEGSVSGIGNVIAPTETSIGSGDIWQPLEITKRKRRKKKSTKKKV